MANNKKMSVGKRSLFPLAEKAPLVGSFASISKTSTSGIFMHIQMDEYWFRILL